MNKQTAQSADLNRTPKPFARHPSHFMLSSIHVRLCPFAHLFLSAFGSPLKFSISIDHFTGFRGFANENKPIWLLRKLQVHARLIFIGKAIFYFALNWI